MHGTEWAFGYLFGWIPYSFQRNPGWRYNLIHPESVISTSSQLTHEGLPTRQQTDLLIYCSKGVPKWAMNGPVNKTTIIKHTEEWLFKQVLQNLSRLIWRRHPAVFLAWTWWVFFQIVWGCMDWKWFKKKRPLKPATCTWKKRTGRLICCLFSFETLVIRWGYNGYNFR